MVSALKLLIVEDDPASLKLMAEVFSSLKADVVPINDGKYAAELINRQKFDGIFLDLEMPDMNGLDLARRIRNSAWNKSAPLIVVTGCHDRNTMQAAFETGVTFFLRKPVNRQKLTRLFRTVRGTMFENRRRSLRVPLHTEVSCLVGTRTLRGVTWNLSQGGVQIEVSDLAPGTIVRLLFGLPGSSIIIDAFGKAIWAKENRQQGIQFTKMSAICQAEIRAFIAQSESPDWQVN